MRRLPVRMLLLGCAGVLLGMQSCSNPFGLGEDDEESAPARRAATTRKISARRAEPVAEAPFRLPSDAAGALLSKVLPPTARPGALRRPDRPAPPAMPTPRFSTPNLPLPMANMGRPRLPDVVKKVAPRPEFVQEEGLEESFREPRVPRRPAFATGKRTRVEAEDVALPPPLPVLAQPAADRVGLDDATMEASTRAVLTAPLPDRKVTPYQRMTTPEPYEHHRALTVKLPDETPEPVAAAPRPPKP